MDTLGKLSPLGEIPYLRGLVNGQLATGDELLPGIGRRGNNDVGGAGAASSLRVVAFEDLVRAQVTCLDRDPIVPLPERFEYRSPVPLRHDRIDDKSILVSRGFDDLRIVGGIICRPAPLSPPGERSLDGRRGARCRRGRRRGCWSGRWCGGRRRDGRCRGRGRLCAAARGEERARTAGGKEP